MRAALVWVVVSAALASDVGAQPAGKNEAAVLFEQGRALVKSGKLEDACPLFARSFQLERAVGTELNLADCHERLGHLADAWRLFDDAASTSEREGNTARQRIARDRANALLARLGTIVIEIAEPNAPGLALLVAGAAVAPIARLERKVDPGAVAVSAHVPDRPAFETSTTIDAGKTVTIKIPSFDASATVSPAPVDRPGELQRARGRVILAGVVGVVGVGALVTSLALGLDARSEYRAQFSNRNCAAADGYSTVCNLAGSAAVNHAARNANIATGFGIGGLLLAVGGAALYVTAPRELVVAPTVTATSAGVAVRGSF